MLETKDISSLYLILQSAALNMQSLPAVVNIYTSSDHILYDEYMIYGIWQ